MRLGLSAGCDALGMSTAYEVIAARHAGMKCFAVSLITNLCQPNYNQGRFHFEQVKRLMGVVQRERPFSQWTVDPWTVFETEKVKSKKLSTQIMKKSLNALKKEVQSWLNLSQTASPNGKLLQNPIRRFIHVVQ